jgi:Predicted periplasmic protein
MWRALFLVVVLAGCERRPPLAEPMPASPAEPAEGVRPVTESEEKTPPWDDEDIPSDPFAPEAAQITPKLPFSEDVKERIRQHIRRRDELGDQLWEYSATFDDNFHIGTMFNEHGVPEGYCYAAGILLGLEDAVKHLGVEDEVDLKTKTMENAHDLRVIGTKHYNYARTAEHALAQDPNQLILTWNLDCPGYHDISENTHVQQGKSSFYEIRNGGKVLMVLGNIERGFAKKLIDALEANPSVETVSLGSGGGYVSEAIEAGIYIRAKGYGTVLWSNCYSACPLVFMGGRQRDILSPYPHLGFHQVYTPDDTPAEFDDHVYVTIYRYLVRMRIDPQYVLSKMWSAPPTEMATVFGYEPELCDANIATWIQRGCSSRDYRFPPDERRN